MKEGVYKTFGAMVVRPPEWVAKMHGGFMADGTPMEDINNKEEFWEHVLHSDGKEIANKAFNLVEDLDE